jgi:hypothetical protein
MPAEVRAADLPEGSIVAKGARVCYCAATDSSFPWVSVEFGGRSLTDVSDRNVRQLLDDGATVLRHGYGEEQP